jgi:hypothetical protein
VRQPWLSRPLRLIAKIHRSVSATASLISTSSDDEDAEDVCEVCHKGDRPTKMLLCDGCDLGPVLIHLDSSVLILQS